MSMKKAGDGRSGFRLPAFHTDEQGKKVVAPSKIKQREVTQAKEVSQYEAKSLLKILRHLDRLSSGGHDISKAIGLRLSKEDEDKFVSDRSFVSRALEDLGQVLESTSITESKLVVRKKKPEVVQAANKGACAVVKRLPQEKLQLDITSTVQRGREVSFEGTGAAIPLCLPNDCEWSKRERVCKKKKGVARTSLVLQQQALDILESITGPICVISIVGPCRTGKSYILSRLIGGERERSHFNLGHKMDPETMGIWVWDTPFQYQLQDGTKVTMILMDTEGIDATSATDRGDNQIFTLSVLLSSLLIYNSMGRPQRDDLQKMNFVANLSKSIQMQAGKKLQKEEVSRFSQWAPKFMWLLRDVILEPTNEKGRPCHVKDYLLQKVLVTDEDECEFELESDQQRIRRNLLSFFSAFDAETLPPPSDDVNVMKHIDDPLYRKEVSPYFLQQVEYVRKRILNNCSSKKGLSPGSLMNGFQLGQMSKLFVEALNSPGGVPALGSTWDRVLEVTYDSAVKGALQCYEGKMRSFHLPSEDAALLKCHGQAWSEALSKFQEALALDTDRTCYEKYLGQLKEQVALYDSSGRCTNGKLAEYEQKNYAASKAQCRDLIETLKGQHLDPIINTLTAQTDFEDISRTIDTIDNEYSQRACGPAKNDVLDEFMKELQQQSERLIGQLEQLKNYDAEAARQMEHARQQEVEAERKEMERRKMVDQLRQSKEDHKAMLQHMEDKFECDKARFLSESQAQLEQQERRLQNQSEAKLFMLTKENELQKENLLAKICEMERSMQQTLNAQQAEMQRLHSAVNSMNARPAPRPRARRKKCSVM